MTKSTLPKFVKHGFWLLPVLLIVPIWAVLRLRPSLGQNDLVTPQLLVSPSPTFSAFPFLTAKPSVPTPTLPKPQTAATQLSSQTTSPQPANPQPANPQSTTSLQPPPSKAELARRGQLALAALSPNIDSSVEMHVAIASGATVLSVAVSGSGKLYNQSGQVIGSLKAAQPYTVQAEAQGMTLGGSSAPNIAWIVPDQGSILYVGERGYRGTLLLVADRGRLWAVNYVNLRQYLYSVVGAEVSPSWPMQALKAQAIAARSYGLTYYFKPANKLYHLGSDEYYQVYKGIESEADTTRTAVDQTAGSFVSYRGGIVESLYAASDDIVADAFQGHGMSQLGALKLAQQGYTYEQILKNYYPKTGVGRIEVDQE